MTVFEFQDKYTTREAKIKALKNMSDGERKQIIASCGTPQGKKKYSDLIKEAVG